MVAAKKKISPPSDDAETLEEQPFFVAQCAASPLERKQRHGDESDSSADYGSGSEEEEEDYSEGVDTQPSQEERQGTHLSKSKEMKKKHLKRSPQKAFRVGPRLWFFRRGFWKKFLRESRRRQRVRVFAPANNKYVEKDSRRSSSKQDKMEKSTDSRNCCVEYIIMTAAGEGSFKDNSEEVDTQPSLRPPIPTEDGIWKPIHVKTDGEGSGRLLRSDPLIEVYDVTVDLCGKKTSGNIHGTIVMDCNSYLIHLFNRDKESAVMIHKKGSLPLNSPDRAPLAHDSIMIFLDLNTDDDLLCKGLVIFKAPYESAYDELLYNEYKGANGSVCVTYTVMQEAWLAELDVKLIKSTEESIGFRIHGDIIVYINDMPYVRDFIFSKRIDDFSTIKSLEPIPLSRSLFCCRCGSSLVVKVDLWSSDTDKPLVSGALLFSPEYYGDSVGKLSGRYGEIQVKVNWTTCLKHPKTRDAMGADILGFS